MLPTINFKQGSLITDSVSLATTIMNANLLMAYDQREKVYRAPANAYNNIKSFLKKNNIDYNDQANKTKKIAFTNAKIPTLLAHQQQALKQWLSNDSCGVTVMPTGAGKTILATSAIYHSETSSLIVVPTIDLLEQWYQVLTTTLNCTIGRLGGGHKEYAAINVTTYDTARMIIEYYGNQYGLLIFDECHHLPTPHYSLIAQACLAPKRLGLTATIDRSDGKEELIYQLLGPLLHTSQISELVNVMLAPYEVIEVTVEFSTQEKQDYEHNRQIYLNFLKTNRLIIRSITDWQRFIYLASRSVTGRQAILAYRKQKRLAQAAASKIDAVWNIITTHPNDSTIVFTEDNAMAYAIGKELCLAVLTHKTKPSERKKMLDAFRQQSLKIIVTSKVLNEGVDVPKASIGIIVSGSASVREHVQRLGRILRRSDNKSATLYEIVTKNSIEQNVSMRRKQHNAYQGFTALQDQGKKHTT